VNRYQFIGNLGSDAEVRHIDGANRAAIGFSVAVTEKWKDAAGNPQEKTTWVKCTIWRKSDQVKIADYLLKGTKVLIEGKPAARAYVDKDGNAQSSLEVTVDNLEFVGGGQRSDQPAAAPASNSTPVNFGGQTIAQNSSPNRPAAQPSWGAVPPAGRTPHEDDLPF
jgi:single-strand DNA-binding protein